MLNIQIEDPTLSFALLAITISDQLSAIMLQTKV